MSQITGAYRALILTDAPGPDEAGRRLAAALAVRGFAVETVPPVTGAEERARTAAFLAGAEPGDLLLVRVSGSTGLNSRDFVTLMREFSAETDRTPAAALLLVVDFGWLVDTGPDGLGDGVRRLDVPGDPPVAAAVLSTALSTRAATADPAAPSLTEVIAEGVVSGAADTDADGVITVADLHAYAMGRLAGSSRRPFLLDHQACAVPALPPYLPPHGASHRELLRKLGLTDDPGVGAVLHTLYHERLSPAAQALLRRSALLPENEELTAEVAHVMLDADADAAWDELCRWGLAPAPDPSTRVFAAALLSAVEPEVLPELSLRMRRRRAGRRAPCPRALLTPDRWTTADQLGHRVHAEAITAFIRSPETRPPLTIGIHGPWGSGKTSLMRMIQELLDPGASVGAAGRIAFTTSSRRAVTNREVLRLLRRPSSFEQAPGRSAEPEVEQPGWRPTVWFNPWMYQTGEQVWSGLAHEIVSQVVERLPVADRERFWLELNLARIDRDEVRGRAYRLAASRLLPALLALVVTLVLAGGSLTLGVVLPGLTAALDQTAAGVGVGGALAVLVAGGVRLARFLSESAGTVFGRLVQQPDVFGNLILEPGYRARTGFLHLVQTDMRRVLKLVATEDRPLVIFVDDLDRCASDTVAQVIEAINLFLAGGFPGCVFVLAMEPELVAAHIEAAHPDLAGNLRSGDRDGRSGLGWRFLEKIVQLPLSLPPVESQASAYVRALLGVAPAAPARPGGSAAGPATGPTPTGRPVGPRAVRDEVSTPDPALVERLEIAIRALAPTGDTLDRVAHQAQRHLGLRPGPDALGGLARETRLAADRVFDDIYSDQRAYDAVESALPALALSNPRELKRYVNVFRFYSYVTYRQSLAGTPRPADTALAKLAALTIRWPHLLSRLTSRPDGEVSTLTRLEEAAASKDDRKWCAALDDAGLDSPRDPAAEGADDEHARWDALRDLLTADPEIAPVADRLL
ncbi:P-loop NTPase fold protein [Rhizohabitans arisaemae]|uniref:P-loop NTPase fold protein n=1 Tax=Rhizohabitans arisaemae TaxID=2720610 RepID=UPI0024B045CB|nr:P-loop NTPase fold protein [Rhizohabitans arisaemae]